MAAQSDRLILWRTFLGAMGLLFGLALLCGGVRVFWLSRSGQTTQGRVVAKRQIHQTKRAAPVSDDYFVAYAFRTKEGQVFSGEDKVPPEFWMALKEGDPITVAYVPSFPQLNWQGDLPDPTQKSFAAFALAMGAAIATWGALKLAKRSRPSAAATGTQPFPAATGQVGLPPLKAERASRPTTKGLLVMAAGVLMAGFAYGPRWLAGTPTVGADPAIDALGLSGIALVVLGFPITIIAALSGSGPSRKR